MFYKKISTNYVISCGALVFSLVDALFLNSSLYRLLLKRKNCKIFTKHLSMYLLYTFFGFNYSRIALALKCDRTTVRYACAKIEDKRDNTSIDNLLKLLEFSLTNICKACK